MRREATTQQEVKTQHEGMEAADAAVNEEARRQGARYNDEARRDATTGQLEDDSRTTRDETQRNDVARRRDGTGRDKTGRDNKGQRDDATTNQMNKRTNKQTNKAGAT